VRALQLLDDHTEIEQLLSFTGQADVGPALVALAEGIVANPLWHRLPQGRLVARAQPFPLLVAIGLFSADDARQLQGLALHLERTLSRFRYVDYPAAEKAACRLADLLVDRFGREQLARFRFAGIPRGGLIVLGMLAYVLGIRRDQIVSHDFMAGGSSDETLVVVDDCALSGVRFQQYLADARVGRVIFCPLYAVPALCGAIEQAEPRVVACLHAEALVDIAPELYGEAYPEWREKRRKLMGKSGYWAGFAEHLGFAWSTPDANFWNPSTERFESGWNLLPPGLCLQRRVAAQAPASGGSADEGPPPVRLLAEGPGPWRPAERVLWDEVASGVVVARLPAGAPQAPECFSLEGVAAEIWRSLLEQGSLEGAAAALLERYDIDASRLRDDLAAFTAELKGHGLLDDR
jgi:hypothetical protein